MYLYKKRKDGKTYYYLRVSERLGERVIAKDIANLGSNPDLILDKLSDLKKYEKEVKKSLHQLRRSIDYERFLKKAELSKPKLIDTISKELNFDLVAAKLHYENFLKKVHKTTQKEFIDSYVSEYSWHTASIEGNTVPIHEAMQLFAENKTPKKAQLWEVYDLRNNKEVLKTIFEQHNEFEIDHITIKHLHRMLMRDVDERTGYRTFDVRILHSRFTSTHFEFIEAELDELFKWYKVQRKKLDPFILSAIFHHRFEQIHPFADGNGRIGRVLLNLILLKEKRPPILIQRKNRDLYRKALQSADKENFKKVGKGHKRLLEYFAYELKDTYWKHFT